MSQPYSKRLGAVSANAAGAVTVGTVPAGKVWIVRQIIWSQSNTGSARGQLSNTSAAGYVDYTALLADDDVVMRSGLHVVAEAGEVLQMTPRQTTAPFAIAVQLHGYELDAP